MDVYIKSSFSGALSYFGVLAYPKEEDTVRAEEFKEAIFFGQVHTMEGRKPREFNGALGPTGKQLQRLRPREYEVVIDRGLKQIFEGHRLMCHLYKNPRAGVSSIELMRFLRGDMELEQGNFYRQLKPLLPAMALHYGLASAGLFSRAPNATDLLTAAANFSEKKVNCFGTVIAQSNLKAWEERTKIEQVSVDFI